MCDLWAWWECVFSKSNFSDYSIHSKCRPYSRSHRSLAVVPLLPWVVRVGRQRTWTRIWAAAAFPGGLHATWWRRCRQWGAQRLLSISRPSFCVAASVLRFPAGPVACCTAGTGRGRLCHGVGRWTAWQDRQTLTVTSDTLQTHVGTDNYCEVWHTADTGW